MAHLEEVTPGVGEGAGVDVNQVKIFKAHLPNLIRTEINICEITLKVFLLEGFCQQRWLGWSDGPQHSSP